MVSKADSYLCGICGDSYDKPAEAKNCEKIGLITPRIKSGAVFLSYRKSSHYIGTNPHKPALGRIKPAKNSLQYIYRTLDKSIRVDKSDLDRDELGVYVFLHNEGIKSVSKYGGMFRGHFPEMLFHEMMIEDPPFKKYKVYFTSKSKYSGFSLKDKQLINLDEITDKEFQFIYPFLRGHYDKFIHENRIDTHKYRDFMLHIGHKTDLLSEYNEIQNLKISLEIAVNNEEYEKAANLRDEIAKIREITEGKKNS